MSQIALSSDTESAIESEEIDFSSDSEGESVVECDFVESIIESDDSSRMEEVTSVGFMMYGALSFDETNEDLESYISPAEDDSIWHTSEAKTRHTLTLAARVLRDGTCKGETPISGIPLLKLKRNAMTIRALARAYIDRAAVSSRALLHVGMLHRKLPKTCAQLVAQFFQPTMSPRDLKRYIYQHCPAQSRAVCVDLDALRAVLPSWFMFDSARPRRNSWESMKHVLWCHAAWTRMYSPWRLCDVEDREARAVTHGAA
eukprot:TRINITY_DN40454_c0_g1_i1.p1 TRINITY_DN40454_c0_g1~~TRINITY_DN40454_c0_g1_i1.p1  ORF type:complete len:258 (-),score=21.46 TRINITY_DN40454_c0_g1_i1:275-1048(-)